MRSSRPFLWCLPGRLLSGFFFCFFLAHLFCLLSSSPGCLSLAGVCSRRWEMSCQRSIPPHRAGDTASPDTTIVIFLSISLPRSMVGWVSILVPAKGCLEGEREMKKNRHKTSSRPYDHANTPKSTHTRTNRSLKPIATARCLPRQEHLDHGSHLHPHPQAANLTQ